jgi:hypothetical protein
VNLKELLGLLLLLLQGEKKRAHHDTLLTGENKEILTLPITIYSLENLHKFSEQQ